MGNSVLTNRRHIKLMLSDRERGDEHIFSKRSYGSNTAISHSDNLMVALCVETVLTSTNETFQGRRANKKAVKAEYNRLSDPGYAAKMRQKEKEEVR